MLVSERAAKPELLRLTFKRPDSGPVFADSRRFPLSGETAWRSNGGATRGHPARALPFTLEIPLPAEAESLTLVGVFAMNADTKSEGPGTLGATIHGKLDEKITFRVDLINGRHYRDACGEAISRSTGDGGQLESIGECEIDGRSVRVDALTIDLPSQHGADRIQFRDLGSSASFILFDVFVTAPAPHGCPFHRAGGGVPLSEIPAVLRLSDRAKFDLALEQLHQALSTMSNVDEARGQMLTFMAMVTATSLELGGGREMHFRLLDLARELDQTCDLDSLWETFSRHVHEVVETMLPAAPGPRPHLMDRALSLVDRSFAKSITDASLAAELGLSTSHFRYLFKATTGQPFHKYVMAVRLEKARAMLVEQKLPVSVVANAVGFTGLAHFSRAFHARFDMSPSEARRA
jgi:AraC-like DNA-binding protein